MSLLDSAIWQGKAFSNGWHEASGGEFAVTEKVTGKQLGSVAMAAPEDVAKASTAAAAAQAGGVRASGTGARFGVSNLEAFTDTRWATIRGDIAPYPF